MIYKIDRKDTEWTLTEGTDGIHLSMEWKNCYAWTERDELDADEYHIFDEPEHFVLLGIELEDDAPHGYAIDIREIFIEGVKVPKVFLETHSGVDAIPVANRYFIHR